MGQIEKQQLDKIHGLRRAYATAKLRIADVEIEKHSLFMDLATIAKNISEEEDLIKSEFGDDAVIDLKTGEVTNGNS